MLLATMMYGDVCLVDENGGNDGHGCVVNDTEESKVEYSKLIAQNPIPELLAGHSLTHVPFQRLAHLACQRLGGR